jgi:hypothetical protein
MISGIIDNWGFDILDEEHKKCINGEIFDSTLFSDGKLIYTSNIIHINLLNNYLSEDLNIIPNVIVETVNHSKYILSNVSPIFKLYIETLIKRTHMDSNEYNFNTSKCSVNCIKWYLNK